MTPYYKQAISMFSKKHKKPILQILNDVLELEGVNKLKVEDFKPKLSYSNTKPKYGNAVSKDDKSKPKDDKSTPKVGEPKSKDLKPEQKDGKRPPPPTTMVFNSNVPKENQSDITNIINQLNTILRLSELGLYTPDEDIDGQPNTVIISSGEVDKDGNESRGDVEYIRIPPLIPDITMDDIKVFTRDT